MADPFTLPINFLQEFSVCQGKRWPRYTFMGFSGEDHSRTFSYRCEFGEFDFIGSGPTKKLAKHESAKKMVCQLIDKKYISNTKIVTSSRGESSLRPSIAEAVSLNNQFPVCNDTKNAISALQEYCQMNRNAMPSYLETHAKGLFFAKCCILPGKLTVGTGASKKQAKLSAASKMCKELNIPFLDPELCESAENQRWSASLDTSTTSVPDDSENVLLETKIIPTLETFCDHIEQLPAPTFQFKNSYTKTFYEFECNVGSFVGRGVHETVEGAKASAAKFVLNELLKSGYHEKDFSQSNVCHETSSDSAEDCNNNGHESYQEYSLASGDKNRSLEYPVGALAKLCGTHRSLPSPNYKIRKQRDSSGNSVVVCEVGSIKEKVKDADLSDAKALAARKVMDRLITEGFPRKDLRDDCHEKEACYGEKYPIGALHNLCSVYSLKTPTYKILERHGECFVISCTAMNICAKGRDGTKKGAKSLAAKSVLHQLLNTLNITHSDHEHAHRDQSEQRGQQNKENDTKNCQATPVEGARFYNQGTNSCGESKVNENESKYRHINQNLRMESQGQAGAVPISSNRSDYLNERTHYGNGSGNFNSYRRGRYNPRGSPWRPNYGAGENLRGRYKRQLENGKNIVRSVATVA